MPEEHKCNMDCIEAVIAQIVHDYMYGPEELPSEEAAKEILEEILKRANITLKE